MAALGVGDGQVVETLFREGVRASTVAVLEWLPALDVCWLDGADAAERNALRVQYAADERAVPEGLALMDGWLSSPPPAALFAAGRRALRARLATSEPAARERLIDAVVARCEAAGRAAGAGFGVGPLSRLERTRILRLRRDLDAGLAH
ncbi:MAG: hypothetical protein AB7I23_03175 [Vicinamibacterales bacterium]